MTVKQEKRWLEKLVVSEKIDAVISDNRFGLYNSLISSVFITHQLSPQTGYKWLDKIARRLNYKYINRFSECWVPDFEGVPNLAGRLSHPDKKPDVPLKYLQPLSRLQKKETEIRFDLCVLISGPEPQRSILENTLLQQAAHSSLKI